MSSDRVAITASAVHIPGARFGDSLLGNVTRQLACASEDAHTLLGRKGLLGKDRATRLALCAAHRALGLPAGRPAAALPGSESTAVVVSSNLGNVQTVCSVVDGVRAGSAHDVSPLQVPNASSNVIASSIAIRFGCTAPNLTVCNGATSGLDAIGLGSRLLLSKRARRVVVVGVEPDDDAATKLAGTVAAAACVVLELAGSQNDILVGAVRHHPEPNIGPVTEPDALRLGPAAGAVNLTDRLGETYGALGVIQAAVAATWLTSRACAGAVLTCGNPDDGYASLRLDLAGSAGTVTA